MDSTDLLFIVGLPSVLGAVALWTALSAYLRKRALVRELEAEAEFLRAMRNDRDTPSALVRATREHVVRAAAADDERFVLSKSLASVRREYAEDEVAHHWAFWFGSMLTGLALLATFILIAYVMTNDISGAIKETSGEDSSAMGHLASAVKTLGGKFYISAAGIGGSVIALLVSNLARNAVFRVAEHPSSGLLAVFTTVDQRQLESKLHELELLRRDHETRAAQHAEVCGYLAALGQGFEKLSSIEVSVKTIGNDVSANLKKIMTEAMGEQLADMVRDTMATVDGIATRVEQNLTQSFGKELEQLSRELRGSLDTLRKAIEGQAQGQLEKILGQLQDAVSGGFQSESAKMAAALDGFAKVVPALEEQLRTMTGKVAEETRQRSEEGARTTQLLLDRVSSLVETLTAQQAANAAAVERMQAASAHGAEEMARRIEASGANLVTSVVGASRAELEAISAQLKAPAEANADRYGDIEAKAVKASTVVAQASESLAGTAQAVRELGQQTHAVLDQVRQGSERMQAAGQSFASAGNTLVASIQSMREVAEATRTQTKEQQALLLQQRQYTKEVEQLWPTLFNTYLVKFREASDELARSWGDFHNNVNSVSKAVGNDFSENTLALSEAVSKLAEVVQNKQVTR